MTVPISKRAVTTGQGEKDITAPDNAETTEATFLVPERVAAPGQGD